MKIVTLALLLFSVSFAQAANMEEEINSLQVNETLPAVRRNEKVYSLQSRRTSLSKRWELSGAWAKDLSGSGFLKTQQTTADLRFHINDNWAVAAGYSVISNEFNDTAHGLEQTQGYLPDVDYAKSRMELRAEYNLFYGKFRLSRDSIFYFDQYVSLGAAKNELASGDSTGPVGELGFAFWWGQHLSSRLALRDYYYKEQRAVASDSNHNVFGRMEIGYVF
jgi:outer membrane beta-barrel protein